MSEYCSECGGRMTVTYGSRGPGAIDAPRPHSYCPVCVEKHRRHRELVEQRARRNRILRRVAVAVVALVVAVLPLLAVSRTFARAYLIGTATLATGSIGLSALWVLFKVTDEWVLLQLRRKRRELPTQLYDPWYGTWSSSDSQLQKSVEASEELFLKRHRSLEARRKLCLRILIWSAAALVPVALGTLLFRVKAGEARDTVGDAAATLWKPALDFVASTPGIVVVAVTAVLLLGSTLSFRRILKQDRRLEELDGQRRRDTHDGQVKAAREKQKTCDHDWYRMEHMGRTYYACRRCQSRK